MLSKLDYTQQLLKQLPPDSGITEEVALDHWWYDTRNQSGLRLTAEGYIVFRRYGITDYQFEIPSGTQFQPKILLVLSRKLTCPYFLMVGKQPSISFFGSKEATMYALYNDVKRFVAALQQY